MMVIKVASKQQSRRDYILNVNLPNTLDYWEGKMLMSADVPNSLSYWKYALMCQKKKKDCCLGNAIPFFCVDSQ